MGYQIDVHYDDGRIECFPETAFSELFGESALDLICIRFDLDIASVGLVVELRHFEPARPDESDFDYQPDHRGFPCYGRADAWPVLVTPEDAEHVISISYNGNVVIKRIGNSLVNMTLLNELAFLYFSDEAATDTYVKIATLYHFFQDRRKMALLSSICEPLSAEEERKLIAKDVGVPQELIDEALAYEAWLGSRDDESVYGLGGV